MHDCSFGNALPDMNSRCLIDVVMESEAFRNPPQSLRQCFSLCHVKDIRKRFLWFVAMIWNTRHRGLNTLLFRIAREKILRMWIHHRLGNYNAAIGRMHLFRRERGQRNDALMFPECWTRNMLLQRSCSAENTMVLVRRGWFEKALLIRTYRALISAIKCVWPAAQSANFSTALGQSAVPPVSMMPDPLCFPNTPLSFLLKFENKHGDGATCFDFSRTNITFWQCRSWYSSDRIKSIWNSPAECYINRFGSRTLATLMLMFVKCN